MDEAPQNYLRARPGTGTGTRTRTRTRTRTYDSSVSRGDRP
ncbi:hypothetical protein [Frigoribacterium sp. CFBP 13707]|nr:hypothetical protein [Frigoribacterium sp. CFBP 13707]